MSTNLRGCVYSMCKFISGEMVIRLFQWFDFRTPAELPQFDARKAAPSSQDILTKFSKSIVNWKDREQAEDGLRALSAITEQVYSVWRENGCGDDVERWDGFHRIYQ